MKPVSIIFIVSLLMIYNRPYAQKKDATLFLTHTLHPKKQTLQFFWKDESGTTYQTFKQLKESLSGMGKKLVFAMNGGMYTPTYDPQGLYIENGVVKAPIDTIQKGYGNFYLQPNGVFYLTKNNVPGVCTTNDFESKNIAFATQSGPMLVIDGKIHPKFKKGSSYLNIRNGVGILPNGNILFVMSKKELSLYDFAHYFQSKGCLNALYLDGFVSKTFLPEKGYHKLDGNFGVIIGEIKNKSEAP
ncbi:phosphodiester glycosidase family protein [Aquimarina brevivitae]|nr:phosphodiester glycosidase family protein [Aquimarina brevivitae]